VIEKERKGERRSKPRNTNRREDEQGTGTHGKTERRG
jgi:hypothetical protein